MTTLPLGRAVRHEWRLAPDFLTVNHGSFGATPLCVLAEQQAWRDRMETQPSRFMRAVLPGALRAAADTLAAFIGAEGKDIAFVDNATGGCNAVLRSLHLAVDDEVLVLDQGYGAVRKTVRFVAERFGARVTEAVIPFPNPTEDAIVDNIAAALTRRTRLAVIDHITSGSALILPLARITAVLRAAGVPVLVDGAHGPGQITLDMRTIGADWYTGNGHKWLCAPKGCAFLWASPDSQDGLHPTIISHGLGGGFLAEFDWTGTRDFSPFLSIGAAIAFHQRLGGEAMRARNIALAAEGAALIAQRLNTGTAADGPMTGAMRLVRLPLGRPADDAVSMAVRQRLLEAGTDAPTHVLAGALWLRLSAFAYNESEDYARLGEIAARVMREIAA